MNLCGHSIGRFFNYTNNLTTVLGAILTTLSAALIVIFVIASATTQAEPGRYPHLDFDDPHLRRLAVIVLGLTGINAIIFGSSGYLAIDLMESPTFCDPLFCDGQRGAGDSLAESEVSKVTS